jgi:hypothetical protein
MKKFKSLEELSFNDRPYRNVNEACTVKDIIPEVLNQSDEEVSLETLLYISILLKRKLKETPVEKRDAIKVNLWNYYKEHCEFFESLEDFTYRMYQDHGSDWLWKVGIT